MEQKTYLFKNGSKFLIYEEKYGYPCVRSSSVPNQVQSKKISPNHMIAKLSKIQVKERIVKGSKDKRIITYKETFIRLPANLSAVTTQGAKRKNCHPSIPYLVNKGEMKNISTQTQTKGI